FSRDWSSDVCSSDLLENASHAILEGTYFGTPAFNPVASTILRPQIGSSPFVFGADGMLESGLLTQAYGSWRGSFENAGVMTDTGDRKSVVWGKSGGC